MASTSTSVRGSQVKRKQMILLGGGALVFILLSLGATYLFTKNEAFGSKDVSQPPQQISLVTGGKTYSDREAWRTQLGSDVANLQRQLAELARQSDEREKTKSAEDRQRAAAEATAATRPTPSAVPPPVKPRQEATPAGQTLPEPPPLQLPPAPNGRAVAPPIFRPGTFAPPTNPAPGGASIATVIVEVPKMQGAEGESGGVNPKQTVGSYIPAGTFARVVLLNGLDAPSGGQNQSNPSPVLLRVVGPATLPNGFRVDLQDCVLTANGIGVVEAERAKLRLDRMACVDPDGGAIDLLVRGYVAGEDGKEGMRGKVVAKTGQMLANALWASVGSGIGEAFKAASETTTVTALGGTTTTTNPGEGFQKGFGQGTQRAFDMLARYYIQLAEKTFPVVEVPGGRIADIVFTRGFVLERE